MSSPSERLRFRHLMKFAQSSSTRVAQIITSARKIRASGIDDKHTVLDRRKSAERG